MNLYDSLAYQLRILYSPIFTLAEEKGVPLWAVLQTFTDGKPKPESMKVDGIDGLIDALFERVVELDGTTNIAIPLGLSMVEPEPYKSISGSTATMPHVFALDIDVSGDNHTSATLPSPADVDGLVEAVETAFGAEATAIASTGGEGRHIYWAFDRSLWDTEIDALKAAVYAVFEAAGFHVDKLSGKGQQMMRAIGTKNVNQGGAASHWLSTADERHSIDAVMSRVPKVAKPASRSFTTAAASQRTTKPTDMKLVGNRLDAVQDPIALLSQFYPLMQTEVGVVYVRPDGTWNQHEQHVKYLPGSGKAVVWGDRLAADTGLHKGYGYGAFSLVTTLFCGGNASLAARALGHLEKGAGEDKAAWMAAVTRFFSAYKNAEAIAAQLPRPKYNRGGRSATGARYSKRAVAA